jgi:CRP-like cAMP-binding protein
MSNLSANKGTDAPILFKAGTVIFAQGKTSKYLYLVKKGEVRLMKMKGNSLNVIQLCGERDILNEVAVLTNRPNDLTAIAKTDVELVLVDQKEILSVINSSPKWIPDIFETLCERLKHTQDMINEHNLDQEKDARLLLNKEDERKYIEALSKFNSDS